MVHFSTLFAVSIAAVASAAPIEKRIAQSITEATADWEKACLAAGGAQQCNPISQLAFGTLLAAPGPCEQQDAADKMIDLAKQLGNDPEMIRLAQLFVQQPRNAPDSLQVPYCNVAPQNAELDGLFHCQFAGSDFTKFSGDQTSNLPLGVNAVNPPGSCPAKPDGPVPDGVQLNTLVQEPRAGGGGGAAAANNAGAGGAVGSDSAASQTGGDAGVAPQTGDDAGVAPQTGDDAGVAPQTGGDAGAAPQAGGDAGAAPQTGGDTGAAPQGANNAGAGAAAGAGAGAKPFTLANGQAAQALNAKFEGLTADSPCTGTEQACVAGGFAQCVGGKFSITPCAGGTICAALPLVNSAGTSITCTTAADRDARIAATGA